MENKPVRLAMRITLVAVASYAALVGACSVIRHANRIDLVKQVGDWGVKTDQSGREQLRINEPEIEKIYPRYNTGPTSRERYVSN